MALTNWGFIYTAPGADPCGDVHVADTGRCRTVLVGVSCADHGIEAAMHLVEEHGVQLIELCGGFGPRWAGRILDAIGGAVPVGVVGYGPEAVDGVHEIFAT